MNFKTLPFPLRQVIYLAVMLSVALVACEAGTTLDENQTSDNPASVAEPASGEWYSLSFTQSINSDNPADHRGAISEQTLIMVIDSATSTIDAALFELNAPDTTAALVRAAGRGVRIRMVVDDEHAFEDPESTIEEVSSAGAQVISDERSALMHNKFFIVDSQYVWTGSTNVTRNDLYNNSNNAILIYSPEIVQNYQAEFNEMFEEGVFNRRDDSGYIPYRTVTDGGTVIETYFAPEDGDAMEYRLIELAQNATQSIEVMAFVYTLDDLGGAITDRAEAGVQVRGVFDSLQATTQFSDAPPLGCAGGQVRRDGNPDILHHKVIIFDRETVALGSFNFSSSARDNNNENMLIITDPGIAAAFVAEFEARFAEGQPFTAAELGC